MRSRTLWGLCLALWMVASGCSSSSGDNDNDDDGGEFAFLAKAWYGFQLDLTNDFIPEQPSTLVFEIDEDGAFTTLDGSDVDADAVQVTATDNAVVFELTGTQVDAGPAFIVVDSAENATQMGFVQYGIDEPDKFFEISALAAGDAPDPFPPTADFDAADADGDYTGTGFGMNDDGTITDTTDGDSFSFTATPMALTPTVDDVFVGMPLANNDLFQLGDNDLATHAVFHQTDLQTDTTNFNWNFLIASPDGMGMVIAACVDGGDCGDGDGDPLNPGAYYLSVLSR